MLFMLSLLMFSRKWKSNKDLRAREFSMGGDVDTSMGERHTCLLVSWPNPNSEEDTDGVGLTRVYLLKENILNVNGVYIFISL